MYVCVYVVYVVYVPVKADETRNENDLSDRVKSSAADDQSWRMPARPALSRLAPHSKYTVPQVLQLMPPGAESRPEATSNARTRNKSNVRSTRGEFGRWRQQCTM